MAQRLLRRSSLILALALLVVSARPVAADTFIFSWDLNTEPEVTGYVVRMGTEPGVYTQTVDVGMTSQYVFPAAAAGQQYCFVVLAYAGKMFSPPSTEVCGTSGSVLFLAQPGDRTSAVGQGVTFQLTANHSQGATITYAATGLPPGLLITPNLGIISGVPTTAGTYAVTVTATADGSSVSRSFTWTIQQGNRAPTLANPGTQTSNVGQAVTLALQGSDPDGNTLSYSAIGLPGGLSLASSTGQITGAPKTAGTYTVMASVSDGTLMASQTFPWTVRVANAAPVLTTPANQATDLGEKVSLQLVATDPNGDTLTYAATGLPAGLQLSQTSGVITGVPTAAGTYSVNVTVSDGALSATGSFAWTVRTVNDAPTLANPGSQTTDQGTFAVVNLQASDPNGDPLTYGATGLPAGLQLTANTGRIAGTPTTSGSYPVTVSASDGTLTVSQSFVWTVRPANAAPVLANPGDQTSSIDAAVVLQLQATDANGDTLTFGATGLPPGLAIAAQTGAISGIPTTPGIYTVEVSVGDGALSAKASFTWTVQDGSPSNDAPILSNPGTQRTDVGQAVSMQLKGSDPNGDPITYGAANLPPGLQLDSATGVISGVPTTLGTFNVTASVTDGTRTTTRGFTWIVRNVNVAPTLTNPGPRTNDVNEAVVLQLEAFDANGDTLTYAATGLPAGLQAAASTGRITGLPTTVGTFDATVTVSDGTSSTSQTFTWTIRASNAAPTLTAPGNQTTTAGQPATLQLQGVDTNGDTLSYAATGLPAGLQISAATGLIAGTPGTPGTHSVTATVSDGQLSASRTFTWTVVALNVAPTLAPPGNQAAVVGQPSTLQLQGEDANGDTLAYTGSGLPPGLQLNPGTGLIAGTPTVAGAYSVTVTVTDGALSANRSFTWEVELAPTAPVLASPANQTSHLGAPVVLQLQATDANGDPLTYAASGLPAGLRITVSTGRISGTPTVEGAYNVSVSVTDGTFTTNAAFTWTITGRNTAPTLAAPGNQTSTVGEIASLQLQGADSSGDTLTYSATGVPSGLQIDPSTGRIAGTPTTPGTYSVTAVVSDGTLTAQRTFTWTVVAPNAAPILAPVPSQSSAEGVATTLQLQGSDANGDKLTYSAAGVPPGLQLAPSTGRISGTPNTIGIYPIVATVSDGKLTAQISFTWTIVPKKGGLVVDATQGGTEDDIETRVYTGAAAAARPDKKPEAAPKRTRTYTDSTVLGETSGGTTTATAPAAGRYTGSAATTRATGETVAPAPIPTYTGGSATTRSSSAATSETVSTSSVPAPSSGVTRTVNVESTAAATAGAPVTADQTSLQTSMAVESMPVATAAVGEAPSVSIETPVDHARFAEGATIIFSGLARDVEDGDLAERIRWFSSVDGSIGTGAMFTRVLSTGTHIITAQVTDTAGNTRRARMTILVE